MEYINKDLYSLNSPELRKIIKEYRTTTGTKVPPISRAKKLVLVDIIKDFDIIKTLKDLNNPNLLVEKLEEAGYPVDSPSTKEIKEVKEITEKLEKIELKDDMSIEEEVVTTFPLVEEKTEPSKTHKLTKEDILNSIDDIRYDIDYLKNYSPQSDELNELEKQLKLYHQFYKQNYI